MNGMLLAMLQLWGMLTRTLFWACSCTRMTRTYRLLDRHAGEEDAGGRGGGGRGGHFSETCTPEPSILKLQF